MSNWVTDFWTVQNFSNFKHNIFLCCYNYALMMMAAAANSGRINFRLFGRLSLPWQTGSSVSVCSRGPLFLYSVPALSCARWTGRQTSVLTIIELIVFFLCYCPLFQESPADQTIAHTWKTGLVGAGLANIRTSFWKYFWTKRFTLCKGFFWKVCICAL